MSAPNGAVGRDRVALVTGASRGIGRDIALRLAALGYRTFGTSREPGPAMQGVQMLELDVDQDASVARAVAGIIERAQRIDAVVNNAGWELMGPVEGTSVEEAKAQMETNFFGVFRVCRAVLPHMRRQGGGYIVNVSSLSGIFGAPFGGLYSASKFAVEGMSEALRFEVRRFGIRVVVIEPGTHASGLASRRRITRGAASDAYGDAFARLQARQATEETRAPRPERVARLVAAVLADPSPAPRYSVGRFGERIVVPLKRLLPDRLFEAALRTGLRL
jgi:NAD(P)-dependent dehydrogenase (short-subunit alcohol dehydrogenase family)